jgi:polar amino acid transport system substrate-binding protein
MAAQKLTLALILTGTLIFAGCSAHPAVKKEVLAPESASGDTEFYAEPVLPDQLPADTMLAIRKRGELRVAVASSIPGMMRNKNGELMGFEVDVLRKLAEDLGVTVKFYPVPWPDLIEPLLDGRVDLVGGIGMTPQRALMVNFSAPYRSSGALLLVQRNHGKRGKKPALADYNTPRHTVGVTKPKLLREIAAKQLPQAKLQVFENSEQMFSALAEGKLSAAVAFSTRAEIEALRFPDKLMLAPGKPLAVWPQAFAVRQGDYNLINYLNSWVLIQKQSGWLKEHAQYWFKNIDWANML